MTAVRYTLQRLQMCSRATIASSTWNKYQLIDSFYSLLAASICCHRGRGRCDTAIHAYTRGLSLNEKKWIATQYCVCVCVCVCVFFPFILNIKFVGRTSRGHTGGRSHRICHSPSFCGACLNFYREKGSAITFPRRPWSRILWTNDLIVLSTRWAFFF